MLKYNQFSDEKLAGLLCTGDHAAYTVLFDRFYGLLFVHACKMLHDEDEAKDIVQELFETLWLRRENITFNTSLSSYLYAAIRHRIINQIAHKQVAGKYLSSLREFIDRDDCLADHYFREREMARMIEQEIATLPEKMQEVFRLSRQEHLSYKEIAQKVGVSEQTVRSHVKRALRILRPKLTTIAYCYILTQLW
jgi:RNA polymerase sigma-70 factor (ECF subfamily)